MPRSIELVVRADIDQHPKVGVLSDRAFRVLFAAMCQSVEAVDFSAIAVKRTVSELEAVGLIEGTWPRFTVDPDLYRWHRVEREAVPEWMRTAVLKRDGGKCLHCGTDQELQMDHVFPWSRGGATTFANLQTLCGPCNRLKGAKV
jgi:hypothetical protein